MKIEMTEDMLRAQIELNDIAVRARGLGAAQNALVLCSIYEAALKSKDQKTEDEATQQ